VSSLLFTYFCSSSAVDRFGLLYAGLLFANLHQGIKLMRLFKVAVCREHSLVIAGLGENSSLVAARGLFLWRVFSILSLVYSELYLTLGIETIYYLFRCNWSIVWVAYWFLRFSFYHQEFEVDMSKSAKWWLLSYPSLVFGWFYLSWHSFHLFF